MEIVKLKICKWLERLSVGGHLPGPVRLSQRCTRQVVMGWIALQGTYHAWVAGDPLAHDDPSET